MNCICGENKITSFEDGYYEVTVEGETRKASGKLLFGTCANCGVVRQITNREYNYEKEYPPIGKDYQVKNYSTDYDVAKKRLLRYGWEDGERILDVGSGSGAFVDVCRESGINAYGCEIGKYSYAKNYEFIYFGKFEELNFPTEYFDCISCHDMLEHVIDPKQTLKDVFRTLSSEGVFVLEIPDYYCKEGAHHWKEEHIWYFTVDQLRKILKDIGFRVITITKPIQSKYSFFCIKPKQKKRTKILLPPGIGDSYWSITKLRSFLEWKKVKGTPEVCIVHNKDMKYNGHLRAFPFLELFPFVYVGETTYENKGDVYLQRIWKEAYAQQGRTIFENIYDCDYFISYNGHLRVGKQMEELDPHLKTEWYPPMFKSLDQINYGKRFKEQFGKYIVFYFVFHGTYSHWTLQFKLAAVVESVRRIAEKTGCVPVFVGSKFDADERESKRVRRSVSGAIDLSGKTTIPEVFGLMQEAELVVGYPSGLTILSTVLGAKTLIIWNEYYNRDFFWHSCPPDTRNSNYFIETTTGLTPAKLTKTVLSAMEGRSSYKPASFINKEQKKIEIIQDKKQDKKVTVYAVLRSGGAYHEKDAIILKNMIERNTTCNIEYKVLSDIDSNNYDVIPLIRKDWKGWWSKIELFRFTGPALYFDLDTVITRNIDRLLTEVSQMENGEIRMLTPFNKNRRERGQWASGIIAWNANLKFLFDNLTDTHIQKDEMDQIYIFREILKKKFDIAPINDWVNIYSYRNHIYKTGLLPIDAQVICFHGRPKPGQVRHKWVLENYK